MKSVGNGMTFPRDLVGRDELLSGVVVLADEVAGRMRKYGVKCRSVTVTIKDANFKSITRQITLETPCCTAKELIKASMEILDKSWNMESPVRLLTITGGNLAAGDEIPEQITLFDERERDARIRQERLESVVDDIRDKFGSKSVRLGGK